MVTWVLVLGIGLFVGFAAGFYFARLENFSNSKKKILQQKLDLAEQQIKDYRSQVSEHFLQTASLVNSMTESYKAVHAHLAAGARELCDSKVTVMQLETPLAEPANDTALPLQKSSDSNNRAEPAGKAESVSPETESSGEISTTNSPKEQMPSPVDTQMPTDEPKGETPATATEPPSTPESLNTVENDSASPSSLSDADQKASASTSRMVH